MAEIRITIPINPTTKKNSSRVFRCGSGIRVLPSKAFIEYQDACREYLEAYIQDKPIDYPVQVSCVFHRETKRRCDLTNLLECIDDVLVHYGILSDDSHQIIVSHDGSRVRLDRQNPRTEITITPMEEIE